jgi:hypothetical protein
MYHVWRFLNNGWQYVGLAVNQSAFTDMMNSEAMGVQQGAATQWYVMSA